MDSAVSWPTQRRRGTLWHRTFWQSDPCWRPNSCRHGTLVRERWSDTLANRAIPAANRDCLCRRWWMCPMLDGGHLVQKPLLTEMCDWICCHLWVELKIYYIFENNLLNDFHLENSLPLLFSAGGELSSSSASNSSELHFARDVDSLKSIIRYKIKYFFKKMKSFFFFENWIISKKVSRYIFSS